LQGRRFPPAFGLGADWNLVQYL